VPSPAPAPPVSGRGPPGLPVVAHSVTTSAAARRREPGFAPAPTVAAWTPPSWPRA